jgi:intergrase/recombinase
MINWIKDACSKLPKSYGNILIYCTLTGLRPTEACDSISLIHKELDNYLKKDSMILEHYKYPVFMRKTKKAFISLVNDSILNIAKEAFPHSYNSLRLFIERNQHLKMHMAYCRKVFATHLRINGISQEEIDVLQGRTPTSVFSRYYFRPDFDNLRIRNVIENLHQQII